MTFISLLSKYFGRISIPAGRTCGASQIRFNLNLRGRVFRGESTKPGSARGIPAALSQPLAFATRSPARQG
jgi:hypothetical protein